MSASPWAWRTDLVVADLATESKRVRIAQRREPRVVVAATSGKELKVLSSTRARAPSRAAKSTATAPPSDSPISTTSATVNLFTGGQPGPGRAGVGQKPASLGLAPAPPVAAIIEDQHRYDDAAMQHDLACRSRCVRLPPLP